MLFVLGVLSVLVIFTDGLLRRVPNEIIVAGGFLQLLTILLGHFYSEWPIVVSPVQAVVGLLAATVVFFPLWRLGVMGAGDVKFLMLIGFCLGWKGGLLVCLVGSLIAGIVAVWRIALTRSVCVAYAQSRLQTRLVGYALLSDRLVSLREGRRGDPYAAFLAIGVVVLICQ